MTKKYFEARDFKPSLLMKRMISHSGDVSSGSKGKIMAIRRILGRKVTFYENGLRVIKGQTELNESEQFYSEILRLAHASLLIKDAVGDKRMCYVDARKNPVEIWVYNMKAEDFIKQALLAIKNGTLRKDFVLDSPIREVSEAKNERNVRLFGKCVSGSYFQNK